MVNNDPIIWAMLNAIKEQQRQIQEQQKQIRTQQRQITRLNGKVEVLETHLRTSKQTRAVPADRSLPSGN
jgi:peptidoglycan hydrolase CwlO-like protein